MTAPIAGEALHQIDRDASPKGREHKGPFGPPVGDTAAAKLKAERDRYVALAFAAGDLLIEIGPDRCIRVAAGACHSLCGKSISEVLDTDIRDLAAPSDRGFLDRVLDGLTGRLDPVPLLIAHRSGAMRRVLMGACQVPSVPDRIFVTMTLLPLAAQTVAARDEETGLLAKDDLLRIAQASAADPGGPKPRELALLRLEGLESASHGMPHARSKALMQEIGAAIRAASLGGDTAGRLGIEEFGIIQGGNQNADDLTGMVDRVAAESGLSPEIISPTIARVDLNVGVLNETEAARALAYVVKSFSESTGRTDFTLKSLTDGLPAAMDRTVARYKSLNQLIGKGDLELVFQPIVSLATQHIHHHEVLSRFPDGQNPYDVISFSEEVGLIEEIDLTVSRKAIAELRRAPGFKLAVNISGRSIQNAQFRTSLQNLLKKNKELAPRLIFELTESSVVQEVAEAGKFLNWLRSHGHEICLDDFGAGATAYNYLRHFDVDFVKIDGTFLKAAMTKPREHALVASIARLCADLGCATIGEMIETDSDAAVATALGIGFGQGWLYGKPASSPAATLPPAVSEEPRPPVVDPAWKPVRRPKASR